jgi:exopolysaccharide production protein ExoZ
MLIYVQILRFLAATAVIAFHAWGVAPNYIKVPVDAASYGVQYGGNGVDLFFVISGFIIYYSIYRTKPTSGEFFWRRIERIVPLYFFVMIAVIVLAFLFPVAFDTPGWFTLRHVLKSFGFISFTDGLMPIVYVGWSLEYEMFFYLCFAALLAFRREASGTVVTIFSVLTIAGQVPGVSDALGNYAFFVNPIIMEFAFGVLVGELFVKGRAGPAESAAAAGAVATLLVTDPGNRAIIFGITSAVLVGAGAYFSHKLSKPSPVLLILARGGDASYSIYLAQVNTVSLVCMYTASLAPDISVMGLVTVATLCGVLNGLLLHALVERPLLRRCRYLIAPAIRAQA